MVSKKRLVRREEERVLREKKLFVCLTCLSCWRLYKSIYITIEGLSSPEAMPNLDVKFKGPNHTAIYLFYLSRCPLTTFKTFYSIFTFKTKAHEVIVYAFYPYYDLKMANKATLSWLNETALVYLVEKHEKYQADDS